MVNVDIKISLTEFFVKIEGADKTDRGVLLDFFRYTVPHEFDTPRRTAHGLVIAENIVIILVGLIVIGLIIRAGHTDSFSLVFVRVVKDFVDSCLKHRGVERCQVNINVVLTKIVELLLLLGINARVNCYGKLGNGGVVVLLIRRIGAVLL